MVVSCNSPLLLDRSSSERGAALTELAIVLPFMILVVLGVIQFGWMWTRYTNSMEIVHQVAFYGAGMPEGAIGVGAARQRAAALISVESRGLINPVVTSRYNQAKRSFEVNIRTGVKGFLSSADLPFNINGSAPYLLRSNAALSNVVFISTPLN